MNHARLHRRGIGIAVLLFLGYLGLTERVLSKFCASASQGAQNPLVVPTTQNTRPNLLEDPPIIRPAPEKEWVPSALRKEGKIEEGLHQIIPPAQPAKSASLVQPKEEAKLDSLLSAPQPSIKVNVKRDAPSRDEVQPVPSLAELPPLIPNPSPVPNSADLPVLPFPAHEPAKSSLGDPLSGQSLPLTPMADPTRLVPGSVVLPQTPPEEPSMKGTKIVLAAILGATLLGSSATLQAQSTEKATEEMKAITDRLERAIRDLQSAEKNLTDVKSANAEALRQLRDDVSNLKNRMQYLEDDLKYLRQQISTQSSISKRADSTSPAISPLRTAKLRLVNDYLEEMSIRVNDRSYRLLPGEDLTITIPAGQYVYQILQLQRFPQERMIEPGDSKTIRVVTQR